MSTPAWNWWWTTLLVIDSLVIFGAYVLPFLLKCWGWFVDEFQPPHG